MSYVFNCIEYVESKNITWGLGLDVSIPISPLPNIPMRGMHGKTRLKALDSTSFFPTTNVQGYPQMMRLS